jgi:hypothetical protein
MKNYFDFLINTGLQSGEKLVWRQKPFQRFPRAKTAEAVDESARS